MQISASSVIPTSTPLLLLMTIAAMVPLLAAAAADPIEVGIMLLDPQTIIENPPVAYMQVTQIAGAKLAIDARNANGGIRGRPVELVMRTEWEGTDGAEQQFRNMSDNTNVVVLFGHLGDGQNAETLKAAPETNLMTFSPWTVSDGLQKHYTKYIVHLLSDQATMLLTLLRYFVLEKNFKRISYMWTAEATFAEGVLEIAETLMSQVGLKLASVYEGDNRAITEPENTTWSATQEIGKFMMGQPQAVLVFGVPGELTGNFIGACLLLPGIDSKMIFGIPAYNQALIDIVFQSVGKDPSGRIALVALGPNSNDFRYEAVRQYHADAQLYGNYTQLSTTYFSMAGYLHMNLLLEVFETMHNVTRDNMYDAVFNSNNIFSFKDIDIGVYNGNCTGQSSAHSKVCNCNLGNLVLELLAVENGQFVAVNGTRFRPPVSSCRATLLLPSPLAFLTIAPAEDSTALAILNKLSAGRALGVSTANVVASTRTPKVRAQLYANTKTASEAIAAVTKDRLVTAVFGSVIPVDTESETTIVDPFESPAKLTPAFQNTTLFLSATLEQQIFATAGFATSQGKGLVIVARSAEAGGMSAVGEMSMNTYGVSLSGLVAGGTSDSMATVLAAAGGGAGVILFVTGLQSSADAQALVTWLSSKTTTTVVLAYQEFATHYDTLVSATSSSAATRRQLLVATSLPNWGVPAADAAFTTVGEYLTAKNGAAPHPLELQALVAARVVASVAERVPQSLSSNTFLTMWYQVSVHRVDEQLVFGPFSARACAGAGSGLCEANVGARKVNLFSLAQLTATPEDGGGAPAAASFHSSAFTDGTIPYKPLPSSGKLSAGAIAGIVIGCVVILGLLAAARLTGKKGRDVACAPKDQSKPFTLIFTDVQNSTSLWATVPDAMGPGLEDHHALIRELIKKHKCYEVKTIGDAFMIACKEPQAAVELALDLQTAFFNHNWGTKEIDDAYLEFEREACEADPAKEMSTAQLSADEYSKVWSGLRVRVGIHTGIGEIQLDPITQGYDYYGNVANTSARVESVGNGGQVLITRSTLEALPPASSLRQKTSELGPVSLRGVPEPVELFQLEAIPGRKYQPLRLDREAAFEEEEDDEGEGAPGGETQSSKPSHAALSYAESASQVSEFLPSLQQLSEREWRRVTEAALFAALSSQTAGSKKNIVDKLINAWRIQIPSKQKKTDINGLVKLVAKRVAPIAAKKVQPKGATETGSMAHPSGAYEVSPRNRRKSSTAGGDMEVLSAQSGGATSK